VATDQTLHFSGDLLDGDHGGSRILQLDARHSLGQQPHGKFRQLKYIEKVRD
jgi:hypothetical protein